MEDILTRSINFCAIRRFNTIIIANYFNSLLDVINDKTNDWYLCVVNVFLTVFDDGDITTLRRTALCLKSGRHFNESETLDQLPLTHPEHFSTPVVVGRRGRRSRQLK